MRCSIISRAAEAAALAALLALASPVARADSIALKAPRAFGYVIGDTLTLEAVITLDPGAQIDPASLPQPRKVSSWLNLVATELTPDAAGHLRLSLTYQTFFSPLEPRTLEIPAWPLTIRQGDARRTLTVPAFAFVTTPLRELVASQGGNPMALQPDIAPRPFPLGGEWRRAGLAAAMAGFGAFGFALASGWRPFARHPRPFAAAARALRRQGDPGTPEAYRAALLSLHRGFDATSGRRLLAEDIGAFVRQSPRFAERESDIARLFAASRTAFFGAGAELAMVQLPPAEVVAIAARLARTEARDRGPAAAPALEEAAS
ncbi:nonribosomal peptide synthetase MxaA [Xanthobacter agilis]|uniref:MxaA protein n=1 Tax=Xanthobacter agilis TaxID=47492 RepID=A0ABU0LAC4_XANAG|nr:nonribosomal peptide synthetase MxaA [Xanthobacter agilis]MDQ0504078.1 mxaA protein [Xanthobacter agilis]